jgi:uncharacterized protein YdeI (YjbR/CyaY-like superfamily)
MDPRVEKFYAKATAWSAELAALRRILRASPLTEEFKWRSPCYTFQGANLAMPFALRDNCGLSFFRGVLLQDPTGILQPAGPNSRSARVIRFTSLEEIEKASDTLAAYLREAADLEKAGKKVDFGDEEPDYPEELIARLDEDADFRAAFEALTPGRRRGYAIHFSQPKQSATRRARIERVAPRIFDGKGMHDR